MQSGKVAILQPGNAERLYLTMMYPGMEITVIHFAIGINHLLIFSKFACDFRQKIMELLLKLVVVPALLCMLRFSTMSLTSTGEESLLKVCILCLLYYIAGREIKQKQQRQLFSLKCLMVSM